MCRAFSRYDIDKENNIMDINPDVQFSTINSIRNNAITNWYCDPWYNVVQALREQQHTISESKDVVLLSPWLYKTFEQGAIARHTDDGQLWTIDDKPVVARLEDNVIGTNMLMLDFDGEVTVFQAKHVFATYTHLGYTSYSHMAPAKNHADCFRIILPLKQFVTAEQLVARRQAIYATFPGIDISCLSLARSFYLPSCPPERAQCAHIWDNDGQLFDVMDFQEEVRPVFASPVIAREFDKQKIVDSLKNIYLGHEPKWFNVAVAMAASGFTKADFREVTIGHLMHEKTEKQCDEKWKSAERRVARGKGMNVGYLINLCKEFGTWVPDIKKQQNQAHKEWRNASIQQLVKEKQNGSK